MMKLKCYLVLTLVLPFCLFAKNLLFPEGKALDFTLAENSQTLYTIVYSSGSSSDKKAADLFVKYLTQLSGGLSFKAVSEKADFSEPFISIGRTKLAEKVQAGQNFDHLWDEIEIFSEGKNLYLTASANINNAVMTLLENDFGCRFFNEEITYIPVQSQELKVQLVPRRERAAFRDRLLLTDYGLVLRGDWYILNRVMPWEHFLHPRDWFCHTYHNIVPMTDFAKTPELFAQVNGKAEPVMICPTHPENLRRVSEMIPAAMVKNPNKRYFSVSQSDGAYSYCKCSRCLKIMQQHGDAPIAAHLQLVKAAANAAADRAPKQLVEFIVYSANMRKAPQNLILEDNIHVWYCSNFAKTASIPEQQEKAEDFLVWRKLVNTMAIWEYGPNFSNYMRIVTGFLTQCENIRFYKEHNVSGIMMQEVSGPRGGDLQQLRAWIFAKLLWNPALDPNKLAWEYCQGVYGSAAEIMYEYYNFVQKPSKEGMLFEEYYADKLSEHLLYFAGQFEKAKKLAAEIPTAMKQLEIDSLPVNIALLDELFEQYPKNQKDFPFDKYKERFDLVKNIVTKHKITHISETRTMRGYINERELLLNLKDSQGVFEVFAVDGRLYSYPQASDPLAEGGRVTRQKTDGNWLVQWILPINLMDLSKKYQLSAEIRLEKESSYAAACGAGCYDETAKKAVFYASIPGNKLSSKEYRFVDIGEPFTLTEGNKAYVYFSASAKSDIGSFYVNRIRLKPVN